jgi:predicted PurR-regulated permease PerM
MDIIKSRFKSVAIVFVAMMMFIFSMTTLLSVFGQETTTITTNSITDLIKTTAEKIKNTASEVANNTTGIISPSEAKNILNQLGEASKKIALYGTDVLSNFSGEIKEGLK